jgi:hypothetical protein
LQKHLSHTHCPQSLRSTGKKFFDDSEVERTVTLKEQDENGNPKTRVELVKQATRLRYRPRSKDFLVSKALTPASLVTIVHPRKPFECEGEVILRGEDRSWIERELLNQQKLSLYSASPEFGLLGHALKDKIRFQLDIEDAAKEHKRSLYFYSKGSVPC